MNSHITDDRIALETTEIARLEALVRNRLASRLRSFRVCLQSTGLILQGRAPSYYTKQLAQHAIMEATCIPIVANDIEVP